MNDTIPPELCMVSYTSFDEAVHMICSCGVGAELVKCVIKSAFCILLVHPQDFEYWVFIFKDFTMLIGHC